MGAASRRPAAAATIVNGALVFTFPIIFMVAGSLLTSDVTNTGTVVRADLPGHSPALELLRIWLAMVPWLAPFAAIAAWRTWVHANRRLDGIRSFRGVLEAGLCGFAVALLVLAPGIIWRTREAPPYVLVYGAIAVVAGLVVGLVLHATALAAIAAARSRAVMPS